ncbi:alpha/beta fold hydrolase [Mycolicibacterium baixiangningiae]|uniref:alpha/beta fold hydrolase n=1 Tax=Mycolicibacterium baixiangningiae TaxID=2761578 RepID=UPI001E652DDC|nr:alpha/beta fold hydrolase [Mycolicibacterium baixiangningiae]
MDERSGWRTRCHRSQRGCNGSSDHQRHDHPRRYRARRAPNRQRTHIRREFKIVVMCCWMAESLRHAHFHRALMRILGYERFTTVAHDVGGWTAFAMAADDPGAITKLVIAETIIRGISPSPPVRHQGRDVR